MTRRTLVLAILAGLVAGSAAWAASTPVSTAKLTVDAPTVCSLNPAADTYVDEASSAGNFGTETSFSVTSLLAGNRRALVHFDLSSCSIPDGAEILSADLKMYLSSAPVLERTHDAHRATASWSETGVTWADQPSIDGTATASAITGVTDGVTLEWDVTSDVAAFVEGAATNHGWLVKDTLEGGATEMTGTYSSRDHGTEAERPVLAVTYR